MYCRWKGVYMLRILVDSELIEPGLVRIRAEVLLTAKGGVDDLPVGTSHVYFTPDPDTDPNMRESYSEYWAYEGEAVSVALYRAKSCGYELPPALEKLCYKFIPDDYLHDEMSGLGDDVDDEEEEEGSPGKAGTFLQDELVIEKIPVEEEVKGPKPIPPRMCPTGPIEEPFQVCTIPLDKDLPAPQDPSEVEEVDGEVPAPQDPSEVEEAEGEVPL